MSEDRIEIPYGKRTLSFAPPPGVRVEMLSPLPAHPLGNPPAALKKALAAPLFSPPLAQIARSARCAAIVISDITRPVPNPLLLAEILPTLEKAGIPTDRITIIVATGTHRGAPRAEINTLVGKGVASRYRVVNHDCRRGNTLTGRLHNPLTGDDIPLYFDRRYVDADLKILTGLVEPHIFCGYSGGRKAVLPGIASLTTIRRWHCPEVVAHPKSTPGTLRGNVAHDLSVQAAKIAGVDFTVNVTLDRDRNVTGIFAGGFEHVFAAAADRLESYVLTAPVEPAKVVVTSSAGWPLDKTFYQAIKGLVAVLPVVAPRGVIVLAARCDEGYGDEAFARLIRKTRDVAEWSKRLTSATRFQLGQWQWQRMGWTRKRARVFFVSDIPPCDARSAFTEPFGSLPEAVKRALHETAASRMLVVPDGPYVLTRPKRP